MLVPEEACPGPPEQGVLVRVPLFDLELLAQEVLGRALPQASQILDREVQLPIILYEMPERAQGRVGRELIKVLLNQLATSPVDPPLELISLVLWVIGQLVDHLAAEAADESRSRRRLGPGLVDPPVPVTKPVLGEVLILLAPAVHIVHRFSPRSMV